MNNFACVRIRLKALQLLTGTLCSNNVGDASYSGALLSLLRQNTNSPFSPKRHSVNVFIQTWYDHVHSETPFDDFRFAYVVTLLAFLTVRKVYCIACNTLLSITSVVAHQQQRNAIAYIVYIDEDHPERLELSYRLPNVWLGILYAAYPAPKSFQFPEDGAFLLIFLCNIYIMECTGQTYK